MSEISSHCPGYLTMFTFDLHMITWLLLRYYSPGRCRSDHQTGEPVKLGHVSLLVWSCLLYRMGAGEGGTTCASPTSWTCSSCNQHSTGKLVVSCLQGTSGDSE